MRTEQVLGDEHHRTLETADIFTTDVDPKQTSRLMKVMNQVYPIAPLEHLKRVKKVKTNAGEKLLFLLAPAASSTIAELQTFLDEQAFTHGEISLVQASRYPAVTRKQFEEWRLLWPMSFHETAIRIDPPLTAEEIAVAQAFIGLAHQEAERNANNGGYANGAVIVDPITRTVVARAADSREEHPLEHATMNCIRMVAEREIIRRERQGTPMRESNGDDIDLGKKRKHELSDAPQNSAEIEEVAAGKSGYLCTDLDLYVVDEPCSMCAMALVHSRIGRVFYTKRKPHGSLGSAYKIHVHPSLNHHYKVYRDVGGSQI
ncbi:adenosine deaminase, tRNA-specific 3 [Gaertneriomyces sp. JEL0708]|nr:adenosine deaminase, tRNA-specific 3 [Gaertneriomyces sp. JEL0708]